MGSSHRVREIEAGVEVDAPVAVFAYSFARLRAIFVELIDTLVRVIGRALAKARCIHAEGAEAGLHRGTGALLDRSRKSIAGVITLHVIARHAAKERVYRRAERLAPDVPQRHVERAERMRSEEHTSELQSRLHLVCRLLLAKKKSTWSSRRKRLQCWQQRHDYPRHTAPCGAPASRTRLGRRAARSSRDFLC